MSKKEFLNIAKEIEGVEEREALRICLSYGHVGLAYYFNKISDDLCFNIDTGTWFYYVNPYWEEDRGKKVMGMIDMRLVDQLDEILAEEEENLSSLQEEMTEKRETRTAARNEVRDGKKAVTKAMSNLLKASKKDADLEIFEKGRLSEKEKELSEYEKNAAKAESEYNAVYGLVRQQKKIVSAMARDIKSYRESAGRKNLLSVAATSVNTRRVKNDDFDSDLSCLCCKNTVLKFGKSGLVTEVEPTPDLLLRNVMGCDFIPGARNEDWLKSLYEVCGEEYGVTPDEDSKVKYLLRIFGAALTGNGYKLRHIPILYGPEAQSGKDTCLNEPLIDLFGGCGIEHDSNLIMRESMTRSSAAADPALLSLPNKRVCLMREVESGQILSIKKLKAYTGGGRATGRQLHSSEYDDKKRITCLFSLTVNEVPIVPNLDRGTEIRMGIIKFPFSFVDDPHGKLERKRDIDLEEKIKSDLPGILNILIEGWQDWVQGGRSTRVPAIVKAETAAFFDSIDQLAPWIEEKVYTASEFLKVKFCSPPERVLATEVYKSYCDWFQGKAPMSAHMFTKMMVKKGFDRRKVGGKLWYYGIALEYDKKPSSD